MASIASTSSLGLSMTETPPQAGPLPSKRGEIGFREDLHGRGRDLESGVASGSDSRSEVTALPARHPADRDAPPEISPVPDTTEVPLTPAAATSQTVPEPAVAADTSSTHSKRSIISFLKPRRIPTFGGMRSTTLFMFIFQILLIGGTIAGWALSVQRLAKSQKNSNASTSPNDAQPSSGVNSSSIFIHVVFGIAILAQLLFLERRIFRLRAERYSYLHPGEMLPTSRGRPSSANMGYAPWLRPPLPTYAAALAQSGHGTGDVEDNAIAVPPPPAYGNTRDSRMLLQGFLRNSLREQRPVSEHSQMSQRDGERPLSYATQDEQWQEIQDAERAIKLEETLGKLEEGDAPGPTVSVSVAQG